ncbi:BglG family transcription antiterminator [Domibacillus sp.]|uniref:BglG family transcription antiterminator n=1 Tax=Domibacillus sp. TaxID=1969783 RepID=UPI0028118025|nr:BglG family transcription antiterminator [Domibacillus sp.]
MYLDERSASLLKLLQHSPIWKMNDLEEKTGLTRRQIQYGFGKINDWLCFNGHEEIQYSRRVGYSLPKGLQLKEQEIRFSKKVYAFSEEDREKIYYFMILLSKDPLSVYHFQSLMGVSRNTVLSDIQRLKENAKARGLEIFYSKQDGYISKGTVRQKRYVIERLVHEVLHHINGEMVIDCIWADKKKQISTIRSELEQIEQKMGITFTDQQLHEFTYWFLCTDQFIEKGEILELEDSWNPLLSSREYEIVSQLIESPAFYGDWNQTEILYATLHLLGMNRIRDFSPLHKDEQIRPLLNGIVEEFERLACVHLHDKQQLYKQLYVHFRPAYYRMKYGFSQTNPLTKRVQDIYPELHHLTKKSMQVLEREIKRSISEDEIAYFTIHFGGWLRKQGTALDERKKAIVVCPNGIGISNILIYTLRELFPDILFLDVLSVRKAAEYPLAVDLVFSTVHLRTSSTLFVVPPILSADDKHKLRQQVMQELYGYALQEIDLSSLLSIISKYATVHEPEQLEKALQANMYTHQVNKHSLKEVEKPVLEELLTMQTIQIKRSVADWKEGIRTASQPLVDIGTIEERYVDAMIQTIDANGPYVVITPNVAIPHARPEQGVRSLSMSLLKLDEPVHFAPDKPVHLIIVLAAVDNDSHLKALVQLTQLLGEPSNIEEMIKSSKPAQLMEYIHKYSKEETK